MRKSTKPKALKEHYFQGIDAPWYQGWDISESERETFRERSRESHRAKLRVSNGEGPIPIHPINIPNLAETPH